MRVIAHLVNPVNAPAGSELAKVQPVVFESMRRAAEAAEGKVHVKLCSVQYAQDHPAVPPYFTMLPDLQRSVADVAAFSVRRELPLIKDILAAAAAVDADYIVCTNADIALMPFFYLAVDALINEGYDAFIINRRRISAAFHRVEQLELMYSEAGEEHLGYDCFVFRKELLQRFILTDICIGIPHAWTDVAHNLFCFASNFRLFTRKHLTFHIGMELYKEWGSDELTRHNRREFRKLIHLLKPHYRIGNIPGSGLGLVRRHFKWLMNPTFHYPSMLALDFRQRHVKRTRHEEEDRPKGLKARYLEWLLRRINF